MSRDTRPGSTSSSVSIGTVLVYGRLVVFDAHEGYDGVFLAVPGTNAHLEFTSGGQHAPPEPNPESLLVLYLGNDEAVSEACERVGADPVEPANPYWRRHGVTLADPDGFPVVLVPRSWPDTKSAA